MPVGSICARCPPPTAPRFPPPPELHRVPCRCGEGDGRLRGSTPPSASLRRCPPHVVALDAHPTPPPAPPPTTQISPPLPATSSARDATIPPSSTSLSSRTPPPGREQGIVFLLSIQHCRRSPASSPSPPPTHSPVSELCRPPPPSRPPSRDWLALRASDVVAALHPSPQASHLPASAPRGKLRTRAPRRRRS